MSEHDEFDRSAEWSVDAIERLGPGHAVPGACRGSGGPGALDWLSTWLLAGPAGPFLDVGGGLDGPSGWLMEHHGVGPVLAEPMFAAASGARGLFTLAAVQADGATLPFADGTFAGAWCLGVLSTAADPGAALVEVARVIRPDARLGLVVYLAQGDRPVDEPEGNHFPTRTEFEELLADAGLSVAATSALDDLPTAGTEWDSRAAAVDDDVARRHGHDPAWRRADDDERHVARLLDQGQVTGVAVRAVLRPE